MNRKKMETLVLVVGTLVVAAALVMYFVFGDKPQRAVYSNIIFALGFLFYIAYNTITTSGLQKEIKELKGQVDTLKIELDKKRKELADLQKSYQDSQDQLMAKTQEAEKLEADLRALQKEYDELKAAQETEEE
jgi:septal ring factor EnvC (AmiA/AmiB activator)